MALDIEDIRDLTRDILYGTGLGEKPTLVRGAGNASVSGKILTITMADGTQLRAGDVLSRYGSTSAADAYSNYILDVTGNVVTAITGYEGAAVPDAADATAFIGEVMPLVGEWKMFKAIETTIGRFLWPEVFDMETDTVIPDLTSGQVDLDSRDEEILHAWQKIGTVSYPVSFHLEKKMDTTLFASGNMGSFDFVDSSTLYYAAKRRINTTDSASTAALNSLIATGAAAIALGATQVETVLDSSKKDAQDRGQKDIAATIWRDFIVQKQVFSEDLSRDTVVNFVVERN